MNAQSVTCPLLNGFRLRRWIVAFALVIAGAGPVRADLVEYRLGRSLRILLQGKATGLPGGNMSLQHPLGTLYFDLHDCRIHDVPTLNQQYKKRLRVGLNEKSAVTVFQSGVWALKHGLLDAYYEAVNESLNVDPNYAEAKRILALRERLHKPAASRTGEADEMRRFVHRKEMKFATSDHFALLYDTPDKPDKDSRIKKPRHEQRLELLERVYESFLLTFHSRGVDLEVPKERLQVVLFNNYADYKDFSVRLSPELVNASGFYLPERNISFFFDHASSETFKQLSEAASQLKDMGKDAAKGKMRGAKDIIRLAATIDLLIQIDRESNDIEVVSHEATHQMASNTGLFPHHVRVPKWVHEGLAAYFESPNDGAWSGIGAVNEQRLKFYRALEPDRAHSNLNFIVGDQIFDYAASLGAVLHGYGQAWALTHFLIEKHFEELMRFYKALGELPPDIDFTPEVLNPLFDREFGADRSLLDQEWRSYMRSLKTDIEEVLGSKK
ncbi:MAG TPA: DUF1570 domain-containing protein [Pirellulales bacterium]|jgi:hypothetical protein|nr:DUF1570 domain-containing protein [Pirellulales bacterium]